MDFTSCFKQSLLYSFFHVMHNLFGDTNAVHVTVDEDGYSIDKTIDGETVADVLEYNTTPNALCAVSKHGSADRQGDLKITTEEGKEFISNYRSGLYGYTYLE